MHEWGYRTNLSYRRMPNGARVCIYTHICIYILLSLIASLEIDPYKYSQLIKEQRQHNGEDCPFNKRC